jgi:hypothetical protein
MFHNRSYFGEKCEGDVTMHIVSIFILMDFLFNFCGELTYDSELLGFWTLSAILNARKGNSELTGFLNTVHRGSVIGISPSYETQKSRCLPLLTWGWKHVQFPKRCFLVFRIPEDRQRSETQQFWVLYPIVTSLQIPHNELSSTVSLFWCRFA